MAQVYPFRAFRYDPARVPIERVLTQPYDKISPAMQERYYQADPSNLITVEKGRAFPTDTPQENPYTRAAAALESWIQRAVLTRDPEPSFYAYSQEYTVPATGQRRTRHGFIGAGKLEEYSAGVVFRHEQTLTGPKADRLELLRHTKFHTGQLFMLYADSEQRIEPILAGVEAGSAPAAEMRDEYDVVHRLWVISALQPLAGIQKAMESQKLVIADGHHRYETALAYRNERRAGAGQADPEAPYERAMMTFFNTRSAGLTILPTHRVVSGVRDFSWLEVRRHLEPWFFAEGFAFASETERVGAQRRFLTKLVESRKKRAIGVYPQSVHKERAFYVLTLRKGANLAELLPNVSPLQRELDVVLLHEGILEPALGITPQAVTSEANLSYEREAGAAIEAVDNGRAQLCFFLNACEVEEMVKIATSGEVMPQKSTDFFPKLMSGMTLYGLDR